MKRLEYKSPDLQQYAYCCEMGFAATGDGFNSNVGGWGDGGSEEGSAE